MAVTNKNVARTRRHTRVRKTLAGTGLRPRLAVFRSLTHIYAQVIDDRTGRTLAQASSLEEKDSKGTKADLAKAVGTRVAEKAKAAGIESVAFDRAGYRYHGRVKALAEAARAGGLKF